MSNGRQLNQFLRTSNTDVLLPSRSTTPGPGTQGSGFLDPFKHAADWMVLLVEGVRTPGWITEMEGFGLKTGWDVKKGKGAQGASLTLTNQPPSKGSITWTISTQDQSYAWAALLPRFKYKPTKNASTNAIAVYHPALADLGVTSVVVEEIGMWIHRGRKRYTRKIDFIVWTPPPTQSIVTTPAKASENSGPSKKGVPPDTITEAQQRRIAQDLKQIQALKRGARGT